MASDIDVICTHCLSSSIDGGLFTPSVFKFSFCESEFYKGAKHIPCSNILSGAFPSKTQEGQGHSVPLSDLVPEVCFILFLISFFFSFSFLISFPFLLFLCFLYLTLSFSPSPSSNLNSSPPNQKITMTSDNIVVIPVSDLEFGKKLGEGGFATVYKGNIIQCFLFYK